MGIGFRHFASQHVADYYDPYGDRDPDEVSEHEHERAHLWDDIHSGIHEMHRGVGVMLSHEDHAIVHDQSRPLHERAHHLLRAISQGSGEGGVGSHWTTDDGVAEEFAHGIGSPRHLVDQAKRHAEEHNDHRYGTNEYGEPKGQPVTSVVLHSHQPERQNIDDTPDEFAHGSSSIYDYHDHAEREVPIRPGHEVPIKGISFKPTHHWSDEPDPEPEYEHHEFSETQHHMARVVSADHDTWYHITDRHDFHPDPTFRPEQASLAGDLGDDPPGLFVTKDPSRWGVTHNYIRPWVAEIHAPKGIEHKPGNSHGGFGAETFIHPQHFDKLHVNRVLPYDAHQREENTQFGGGHGAMEDWHGKEFDTGHPISHSMADYRANQERVKNYRYQGTDARDMPEHEVAQHHQRWHDYMINDRGVNPEYFEGMPHRHAAAEEPVSYKAPDFETPACTYCGSTALESQGDNGRAERFVCSTCGGSMVAAPGDQPMPDLIGSPHNHPSGAPDPRGGGGYGNPANGGVVHDMQLRSEIRTEADLDRGVHPEHERMAQAFEKHDSLPVKHGGFAGYVEPEHGFDDAMREADEIIDGPGSHERKPDEQSVGHHTELGNFLSEHIATHEGNKLWHQHGTVGPIDIRSKPVYATQPGLSGHHLARYLRNPGDKTHAMHLAEEKGSTRGQENRAYPGNHMPMLVHHQGNLFAVEGHHRTARALLTGESHVHGMLWDADKHGLPHTEDQGGEPIQPGHEYSGFQRYSSLAGVHSCAHPNPTRAHAIHHHDDGICTWTEARRGDAMTITAARDDELGFHLTAAWVDVQEKAARITREGGVHIAVSSGDGIGGTVRGDHNLYETFLTYVPGSRKVGYWNCGCKWGAYAWGRSAAYKRFEGRMCSHALAMQYTALKQHAFNRKQVEEHDFRPAWMREKHVVVQHERASDRYPQGRDHMRWESALVEFEGAPEPPDAREPVFGIALAGVLAGEDPGRLVAVLEHFGARRDRARTLVSEAIEESWHAMERTAGGPLDEFRRDIMLMDPTEQHSGGGGPATEHKGNPSKDDEDEDPGKGEHQGPDGTPDDGSGDGQEPASHSNNPLDPNHHTHRTQDSRDHAPDEGWGVLDSEREPSVTCTQCNDQGCGHCQGAGQVDLDDHGLIPDQNADAGAYARGTGKGSGGIPNFAGLGFAERAMALYDALRTGDRASADRLMRHAEYTSYDSGPDMDARMNTTRHDPTHNPGSTGYATSSDPADWSLGPLPTNVQNLDSAVAAKKPALDIPTHAGVALKAHDTGRVLMLQRSFDDEKDPARGKWEFPGGGMEKGDHTTLHGGIREWEEEVGQPFPGGVVHHTWRSGPYQGHIVMVPSEKAVDPRAQRTIENPDDDNEVVAWLHPHDVRRHQDVRDEVKSGTPWKHLQDASLEKAAIALDHPEPALPTTEGEELTPGNGDGVERIQQMTSPAERYKSQMVSHVPDADLQSGVGGGYTASAAVDDIVARFQASAGAAALNAPSAAQRQAEASGVPGGGDIAAAASAHLAKVAMKDFTPTEQRALIGEGEGGPRARNFGDLKIEGTHYAEIDDEELTFG